MAGREEKMIEFFKKLFKIGRGVALYPSDKWEEEPINKKLRRTVKDETKVNRIKSSDILMSKQHEALDFYISMFNTITERSRNSKI